MIATVLAKCGSPGLLAHRNRPAISPTGLYREWRPILNELRERSGARALEFSVLELLQVFCVLGLYGQTGCTSGDESTR